MLTCHNSESTAGIHVAVFHGLAGKKQGVRNNLEVQPSELGHMHTHQHTEFCLWVICQTRQPWSSTYTDASILGHRNISTKAIWRMNSVKECVCVSVCCSCMRYPWCGACHYSVKLLLAASFGIQNALLLSWSCRQEKRGRDRESERKKLSWQVHLHSSATVCQARHTYPQHLPLCACSSQAHQLLSLLSCLILGLPILTKRKRRKDSWNVLLVSHGNDYHTHCL